MQDHIIVVSHRRSGTHLVIDLIRNNFSEFQSDYVNLDRLKSGHEHPISVEMITRELKDAPRLLKSHMHSDVPRFFWEDQNTIRFVQQFLEGSKVIYVYRDGRDVLTSLFYYSSVIRPNMAESSFSSFIRMNNDFDYNTYEGNKNRPEYWSYHVNSWYNKSGIFSLSYEQILTCYNSSLDNLARYLELDHPRSIVDVRRKPQEGANRIMSIIKKRLLRGSQSLRRRYTSIEFRKGEVSDYLNIYTEDDLKHFYTFASGTLEMLNYL